jgi:hypothetical protein
MLEWQTGPDGAFGAAVLVPKGGFFAIWSGQEGQCP